MAQRTVLITGATGKQGGAAARHLLRTDFKVRALTRDPSKPAAKELEKAGAEVVQGNLNDRSSLEDAANGVYGVFSVQNFWETGYDQEVAQGKRMADVAKDVGVKHFVYSSVGSADQNTGISHFDSKAEVEEHVRSLDMPYTILRPVWFMNNWESDQMKGMVLSGTLAQPLSPDTTLQQIAVDDIGVFAAMAFRNPDKWIGRELDIAGDEGTMTQLAADFSKITGIKVEYQQVPWDDFRQQAGDEYADMYRWFEDVGYHADIERLRKEHSALQRFDAYLAANGWRNVGARAQAAT